MNEPRRSDVRWIVLLALLASSCVAPRARNSSLPAAHAVWASQFVLRTNFALSTADPLVTDLVAHRRHVYDTLGLVPAETPIEIYIFDDRAKYEGFLRRAYPELPARRAFFIAQGPRQIVYTFWGERLDEDLRHEATHALLHSALARVPLWLDEGLAEYFEPSLTSGGWHAAHVRELREALRTGWFPNLPRLERLKDVRDMSRADYREAWAWVHFMVHSSPETREVLLEYLRELRGGAATRDLSERLGEAGKPEPLVASYVARLVSSERTAAAVSP
jgi:hypothetical protein